jgi:uncharacterized Zn finger protein
MAFPSLTHSDIRAHTAGGSFERGEEYFADGAVRSVKQTDDHTLKAQVQGSDVHPYLVTIQFDADNVQKVKCTCPYYEGSWCKHIVAVLLKVMKEGGVPAEDSTEVTELIDDLDRSALMALIERLVEHDPELLDQIQREHARLVGDK